MPTFELYDPKGDNGFSSIFGFNEDNIKAECRLVLDNTKQAFINSLSTKLIAYNPVNYDYFELDSFNVDYTEVLASEQQLTFNGVKGYPNSITDEQNEVNLVNTYDLGNELVTNGDFSNGLTGWSGANISVTNNECRIYSAVIEDCFLRQSNVFEIGKKYIVSYDIIATNGNTFSSSNSGVWNTSLGKQSVVLENIVSTTLLFDNGGGLTDTIFDNISVKEIIEDPNQTSFSLNFGQKINWKDWVYNRNANTLFYNNAQPNNNLNYKSSNYSDVNDYEIRLGVQANIYGVDDLGRSGNTDYFFLSQQIQVNDYDSNTNIDGTIELFDTDTNTSLGTSPRTDKDTLFKATWTDQLLTEAWGVNRIERADNVGFAIYELSSLTDYEGGILKPVSGENRLKIEQVGNNIEATCLIDYTKLEEGVNYNLSARINLGAIVDPNSKLKTDGAIKLKTDAIIKIKAI